MFVHWFAPRIRSFSRLYLKFLLRRTRRSCSRCPSRCFARLWARTPKEGASEQRPARGSQWGRFISKTRQREPISRLISELWALTGWEGIWEINELPKFGPLEQMSLLFGDRGTPLRSKRGKRSGKLSFLAEFKAYIGSSVRHKLEITGAKGEKL